MGFFERQLTRSAELVVVLNELPKKVRTAPGAVLAISVTQIPPCNGMIDPAGIVPEAHGR